MGLFSGGGGLSNVASNVQGVLGAVPIVGGLFQGSYKPPSFSPAIPSYANAKESTDELNRYKADVEEIRKLSKSPISGIRDSAKIALENIDQMKKLGIDQLREQQSGLFSSAMNQASQYGTDRGTVERLSKQSQREASKGAQGLFSNAMLQKGQLTASDLADQQALRDKALFDLPNLSGSIYSGAQNFELGKVGAFNTAQSNIANIQNQAAAANLQSQLLERLRKQQSQAALTQQMGTLGGAAAGYYLGGGTPAGAAIGAGLGGTLFSGGAR